VFLPSPTRITTISATLGEPVDPGQTVLAATSTLRQVTATANASQDNLIKIGDKVAITLGDEQTIAGVVSAVGTVAVAPPASPGPGSASGSTGPATISVAITPLDPAATGIVDRAPVEVAITTARRTSVLAAPIAALQATPDGHPAVEVVSRRLEHLVAVSVGLFDDDTGLVQISGAGLAAGEHVVLSAQEMTS